MTIDSPSYTGSDSTHTCNLSILSSVTPPSSELSNFFAAMRALDAQIPITSLIYGSNVLTITFVDLRLFVVTVTPGAPPTFEVQTDFFTQPHIQQIQGLTGMLFNWLNNYGITQLEATY